MCSLDKALHVANGSLSWRPFAWMQPADPSSPTPARRAAEDPNYVRAMFGRIARRYDVANTLLSGGLDRGWRRRAVARVRTWEPGRVLDLATGSGALAAALRGGCAAGTRIVGADFCEGLLRRGRDRGADALVAADGLRLPFADGSFDVVTVAFGLRNMASWPGALREMSRVLRPDTGHLLVLDFSLPENPVLRAGYSVYLHRVLPRLAALVSGERAAYDYLGESIEGFPRGAAMRKLIEGCGFADAAAEALTAGVVSLYTARRGAGDPALTPSIPTG